MSMRELAAAMRRVEDVLEQRPSRGLHQDAPAVAHWESGTRVMTRHENGVSIATDMPRALGGTGDQVTPGWLFRAALASCTAVRIAMGAAAGDIELLRLEVDASSRSDTRGLLGMADADGERVNAALRDVEIRVRIAARGATEQQLRDLVERSYRCSPVPSAVTEAMPVALHVEIVDAQSE